ncbi:MAG: DsrE/DsrF/DrsH-like family protein [Deltaproteobacteria bacterium]|nr:DsrE/DsrF/DrsH-like family protein [Deltaproteobacteria bacterium]
MTATAQAEPAAPGSGPQPALPAATERKVAIILSKGSLDMAYPALILANAARMSGIGAMIFFTFWGLDVVTEKKVDRLHVSPVGNPSMGMPTALGGLPGMEALASRMMKKEIAKLDIPGVREFLQILKDAGAELYGCGLAMDMFKLTREDLVPQIDGVLTAMDFFDKAEGAQIIFV